MIAFLASVGAAFLDFLGAAGRLVIFAGQALGADYGVDDAAADAGTIGYEILCALGSRYHRIYRAPPEPPAPDPSGANRPE